MEAFIKCLPKAELHLHIEGTLEPDLMFRLATKHGITLPYTLPELVVKRQHFLDLQDFLNLYYEGCNVLRTEEDFYELAMAYCLRAKEDGVRYAEVFFDPQTHMNRGIAFGTVIQGLTRAATEVAADLEVHYILSFLRDLSEDSAFAVIEAARPFSNLIWGVGIDSSEVGNPPRKFQRVFSAAQKAGLCGPDGSHMTAHGGEEGDPSYVIEALAVLHCRRIDHGVRSLEDPYLLSVLRENRVPLTVCPLSNLKLKVNDRYFGGREVIEKLLQEGILVSINSDDPAYFGGYIADNYKSVLATGSQLSEGEKKEKVVRLAKNSFQSAFISSEKCASFIALIDSYVA